MSYRDFSNQRPTVTAGQESLKNPGPFLARVIDNFDPDREGAIRVQVIHEGSTGDPVLGESIPAYYLSHYWGGTAQQFNGPADTFQDTQKSWGMWIPTPEIGSIVVVIYIEGNSGNAYWLGGVIHSQIDSHKNFGVPDSAATSYNKDDQGKRLPVAEFNSNTTQRGTDENTLLKPTNPIKDIFELQGLLVDDVRGITTSSARRESPSKVFGFNTPGPIDYKSPKKDIGTPDESSVTFVHKLGGSSFVMDDGDDKFFRKTSAGEGPPEYEKGLPGDKIIPHNELVRIRTRTGHQILLHNSEDLIYIGNARGTTWIELTSNGKIDIFAEDSISIHTKNDLNIKADNDINLEAGKNINMKSNGNTHLESTLDLEILSLGAATISATKAVGLASLDNLLINAKMVHINSPGQVVIPPIPLKVNMIPDETGTASPSILLRVPSHEPWPFHENLNPADFVPAKTNIKTGTAPAPSSLWKAYTAPTDTFKRS
jgi:hypothetical protein